MNPPPISLLVRLSRLAAAFCIALSSILVAAQPAQASQFLSWDDEGAGFGEFGPNEAIIIGTGAIDFIRDCPDDGVKDFLYPTADVYLLKYVPSQGSKLRDITGNENMVVGTTLSGAFVNQLLGVTLPGGKIPGGRYSIVYDECQDGTLGPEDAVFANAVIVNITTDAPPLPAYIAEMKKNAAIQARDLAAASAILGGLISLMEALSIKEILLALVDGGLANMVDLVMNGSQFVTGQVTDVSPQSEAMAVLLKGVGMYQAIAKDPPDPDFRQLTLLPAVQERPINSTDPVENSLSRYAGLAGEEVALAEAHLHALERYQGAELEGDGEWALVQARTARAYALLLADLLLEIKARSNALAGASGTHLEDADASELEAWRAQAVLNGLSEIDVQNLSNFGMQNRDRATFLAELKETKFESHTTDQAVDALSTLEATQMAQRAALLQMATEMESVIAALMAAPTVVDTQPVAEAGGPYVVGTGQPLALDGSASKGAEDRVLEYAWDLDSDGIFDDATGSKPTVTLGQPFEGYVGLLVTDNTGRDAVDYARITVNNNNAPPVITNTQPVTAAVGVEQGAGGVTFSASVTDPNGDPLQYTWLLDDMVYSTGSPSVTLHGADGLDVGFQTLRLLASDGKPGGVSTHEWTVALLYGDADGDGWRSNVDCEDGTASIHPGQDEVVGNTIDDDCNPRTTDSGLVLPPDLVSVTKLADTNDGVCDDDCSLREAVIYANNSPEQMITITLAAGVHKLTIPGIQEEEAATGDLDLRPADGQIFVIQGQGATTSIIDLAGLGDRAFQVFGGEVTIQKLTIRNGRVDTYPNWIDNNGGAITLEPPYIGQPWTWDETNRPIPQEAMRFTLRDAKLLDNYALWWGGGLGSHEGPAHVTIERSEIARNEEGGQGGGGIGLVGYGKDVLIVDTTIRDNIACSGGGVSISACQHYFRDVLTVRNSFFTGNVVRGGENICGSTYGEGREGAAINIWGSLYMDGSILENNRTPNTSVIYMDSCNPEPLELQIANSSITNNAVMYDPGQFGPQPAYIWSYFHETEISNTLIADNDGVPDDAFAIVGHAHITNTAVMRNEGGGLFLRRSNTHTPGETGDSTLVNSTIYGNSGYGLLNMAQGGPQGDGMPVANSILANNALGNCQEAEYYGPINSQGYNITNDDSCLLRATGDMTNTNPLLATEVVDGVTRTTHQLTSASPAVDAVGAHTCPPDDIDGVSRPQVARCDIGASEYTASSLLHFAKTRYTVSEAAQSVILTVVRNGDLVGAVTVHYETMEGSAKAGTDYTATSGTLTFAANQTSQQITIGLLENNAAHDERHFTVLLDEPTGGALLVGIDQAAVVLSGNTAIYLPMIQQP